MSSIGEGKDEKGNVEMKVRMCGRRKSNAAFATVCRKECRCPDCGAEIALKDIDVRTDMMLCRSCGKRHSLKRQVQREASQRDPGEPPRGVIVQAGVATPDGPGEDRVIYPHRSLPLLAFLLCFAGMFGYGVYVNARCGDWGHAFLAAIPAALAAAGLMYEAFGRTILRLSAQSGEFESGFGPFARRASFCLSSETSAFVEERTRTELVGHGETVREVVVENARGSVVRFGSFLMHDVQDYFCACIARRAAGYPLQSRAGARRLCLAHPLAFTICMLALVTSVAFAFSSHERIRVADGMLIIEQSQWWGRHVERTEISASDITYVDFKGIKTHDLLILGANGRVLKRLTGYGRGISGYQIGLMESLKCHPGMPFDASRFPNKFFAFVGFLLLIPLSFTVWRWSIKD
jgi:hypothetical protein